MDLQKRRSNAGRARLHFSLPSIHAHSRFKSPQFKQCNDNAGKVRNESESPSCRSVSFPIADSLPPLSRHPLLPSPPFFSPVNARIPSLRLRVLEFKKGPRWPCCSKLRAGLRQCIFPSPFLHLLAHPTTSRTSSLPLPSRPLSPRSRFDFGSCGQLSPINPLYTLFSLLRSCLPPVNLVCPPPLPLPVPSTRTQMSANT